MENYNFVAKFNFESSYCNIVTKTHLYNDIYEYHVTSKIGCDNIEAIINKVKLVPLVYICSFPETEGTDFTNIVEILTNYLNLKLGIQINNITVEPQDDNWVFTPYLLLNTLNYVYVEENNYLNDLDLYPLKNFLYVSTSEFTPFAHKQSEEPNSTLINVEGMYLLENKYEAIVYDIQKQIEIWENDGVFTIKDSPEFESFAQLWNIKRLDNGLYQSKSFDLQWITTAFYKTKLGELPLYHLTDTWIFSYKPTQENKAFFMYAFLMYYASLITKNLSLLAYIEKIELKDDLSISAHFGTYEEAVNFKPNIATLQSLSFQDLETALKTKILLDAENTEIISLIIPLKNLYWLVWSGASTLQSTQSSNLILGQSKDKILYNIISGKENIAYAKLYLKGILKTDISSGLIALKELKILTVNTNLKIHKGILYSDTLEIFYTGAQTSKTVQILKTLWEKGFFLSNWGITIYLNLGIINCSSLKIPEVLLDLKHKKNYNLLGEIIDNPKFIENK